MLCISLIVTRASIAIVQQVEKANLSYGGKIFVCTGSRWNLHGEYGDESHPGFSCKDIKDRKGEESANGIYWIKLKGRTRS